MSCGVPRTVKAIDTAELIRLDAEAIAYGFNRNHGFMKAGVDQMAKVAALPHSGVMTTSRLVAARRFGWALVAVCLVGVGLWVIAQAVVDAPKFDRWVGWANLFALPAGAVGTALVILDRLSPGSRVPSVGAGTTADQAALSGQSAPGVSQPPATMQISAGWGGIAQGTMGKESRIINHGGSFDPPGTFPKRDSPDEE